MNYRVLSSYEVRARKPHRCEWCSEAILVGATYWRDTGKFDDDFQSLAYHIECYEASMDVDGLDDVGFVPGTFQRGTTNER